MGGLHGLLEGLGAGPRYAQEEGAQQERDAREDWWNSV